MNNDADLQKWWRQQVDAPPPSEKELEATALRLGRRMRNKLSFSIVLLAGTAVFIWGVVYTSKPDMATTYVGTALVFLAIALQLGASRGLLSLLLKEGRPDQDARHYLDWLIRVREKQKFLQTRVLSLYYLLLSAGVFLYMIEYARRMDTLGRVLAYGITGGWFALSWWVLRPRVIRKETGKLIALIARLEKIQAQLDQPEAPEGPEDWEA